MIFKIFFLLLSIILTANTALGQTEDEILRDSYENCRVWSNKSLGETISINDFWYYMGKSISDQITIIKYSLCNPKILQDLDLEQFSLLFKQICSERGVFVKDMAATKKTIAASRTIHECELLEPETTDYEDEEQILKYSFDNCRKWLDEPLDANIGLSGFCCYMGLNESDTVLNDYFKNNPHASKRMADNYDSPCLPQGPIDFTLYRGLFNYICSNNGVLVKNLVKHRKSKAAARTLHEYMSLPAAERD